MSATTASIAARNNAPSRTPSVRQVQDVECGVAALAIVLAHYGAWIPYPELRRRCQVSDAGVTALSLVQAGKHYGLTLRGMRLDADSLAHVEAPVILFWEHGHFLVLEGIRGDTAWLNDPARGHRTLSLEELKKGYSGIVLIAKPGTDFRTRGSAPQPVRAVADILRPGRWPLALLGTSALAESLLVPFAIELAGKTMRNQWNGRASDARPFAFAVAGLGIAGASRTLATHAARSAIAREIRQKTATVESGTSPHDYSPQPALRPHHIDLADIPATTAVRVMTSGIRMTVAVPLLVLLLGRIHPAVALVTLPTLAARFLLQQATARVLAGDRVRMGQRENALTRRLQTTWPLLRPWLTLSPATVTGIVVSSDRVPSVITVVLANQLALRIVDHAASAADMLYLLPESIVQLLDVEGRRGVAEQAVW